MPPEVRGDKIPLSAMCGRLPVGKSKLHVAALVQPCVRPVDAVHMTAGHNALRGSGPLFFLSGSTGSTTEAPLSRNRAHLRMRVALTLDNPVAGHRRKRSSVSLLCTFTGPSRSLPNCVSAVVMAATPLLELKALAAPNPALASGHGIAGNMTPLIGPLIG